MKQFMIFALVILLGASLNIASAMAVETDIDISVKAKDAKFIGTTMGGVWVEVRDARSGDVLANGMTYGGTGDTDLIMGDSERDKVIVSPDSAKLSFSLDLFQPVAVIIKATGPLGEKQSQNSVIEKMLLIPGKDYTSGNGIMLEMQGFVVTMLEPAVAKKRDYEEGMTLDVKTHISKLCGCEITEDGYWPVERYEIDLRIYKGSFLMGVFPMTYTGSPGEFMVRFVPPSAGTFKLMVTAFDKYTKEAGHDSATITLRASAE